MVNTFLVHRKYKKSAQKLDNRRLGKQRVEAYQILCLCQDLNYLSKHYNLPISWDDLHTWIRLIAKKYKAEPFRFVKHKHGYESYDLDIVQQIPKKAKFKAPVVIQGISFYPTDRVVSLGFCYHPAVKMWLGYEEALMFYIDEHIQVWIDRGFKNTMERYSINEEGITHPSWVFDKKIHRNHKASLLNKEKERNEKPWYIKKKSFVNAGEFVDYIWPV